MGKAGRFACIFVPMALSIASLICLIIVALAQTNRALSVGSLNDLYFFKANTKDFTVNPDLIKGTNADNELLSALQGVAKSKQLKDFYKVGLWNYCEGDTDAKGKDTVTYCSPRQSNFWFNPVEVWDLQNTTAQQVFPDKMKSGLNAYRKVAKWMFIAYIVAMVLTGAEIIIGIAAIFSRWGSFVTTIVSTASSIFTFAAAVTSTALYGALTGTFDSVLKPMNIKASMSTHMLAVVWIAVAFSLGSGLFWLFSVCCCSGKSGHKKPIVEKAPYSYQRVSSPYLGPHDGGHQMHNMPHSPSAGHGQSGHAYEPFRHGRH